MGNVFTLYGELKADTTAFSRSLRDADAQLQNTKKSIEQTEKASAEMGRTSATNARQFQKFNEVIEQQQKRLHDAAEAYKSGDISARKYASVVGQTDTKIASLNSRLKDTRARMADFTNGVRSAGSGLKDVFGGVLLAGGVTRIASAMKNFAEDGVKMFGTLDKLTRFTATLDKNFQTPQALLKFREDIKKLSTEIPHSAEDIAKASFTIKSAFSDLTETQLIDYLRQFGEQATASNTDIATHAFNMAALAKQYKITAEELPKFGALMSSAFGKALAEDAKVSAGFNRVLASALSLKQPIGDLAAAMGTLQSVSSDAENNTTLLLNVYSKLTDKKYIEGIKDMGVAVFDTAGKMRPLNDIINDLATKLKGLNDQQVNDKLAWAKDQQARQGLLTLIRSVEDYNKTLKEGADQDAFAAKNKLMLESTEARWEKFVNKINNLKMGLGAGIVDALDDARTLDPPKSWSGEVWRGALIKGLRIAITGAYADVQPLATHNGESLGENLAAGMSLGIAGGQSGVINAAIGMATRAYQAAKDVLGIQSPSKKFKEIGEDVAQGFIDGIASLKTGVQAAMASLLDVTGILGKLGKKDAPGVQLLSSLIEELDRLTPRTKLEAVMAELTAEKYKKLNEEVRKRIVLAAQQLDLEEKRAKLYERYSSIAKIDTPDHNFNPNADTIGTGSGTTPVDVIDIPPPPFIPWDNFWATMQIKLQNFRDSLPSLKEAIGTNLIDSIAGIGDVFANAVARWDGTAKGFFQSIAQGFRQMIQQIIAELIRLVVMKAILKIVGGFSGGFGGGGAGAGGGGGDFGEFASGGYTGGGSPKDVAGVVHKREFVMPWQAVKKWGLGNLEAMKNLQQPQLAMAGGYMGGGSATTYNNSSWAPTINIHVSGGGNPQQVRQSAKQGVAEAMRMMEHERRRNK